MPERTHSKLSDLAFAFAAVFAACLATLALYHFDSKMRAHGVLAFLLAAVAVSAWRAGSVGAIFATLLSAIAAVWFLPPADSFRVKTEEDAIRYCLFVFLAFLISSLHPARARAERSLQESEARLRFSLDSAGIGCWDANIETGTFWKSHNLASIFGQSEDNFATTYEGFFAYIYPEDREFFQLAAVGDGAAHRDYEIVHRIVCSDGSLRRVRTRGRMYLDEGGSLVRMVGTVYSVDNIVLARPAEQTQSLKPLPMGLMDKSDVDSKVNSLPV